VAVEAETLVAVEAETLVAVEAETLVVVAAAAAGAVGSEDVASAVVVKAAQKVDKVVAVVDSEAALVRGSEEEIVVKVVGEGAVVAVKVVGEGVVVEDVDEVTLRKRNGSR